VINILAEDGLEQPSSRASSRPESSASGEVGTAPMSIGTAALVGLASSKLKAAARGTDGATSRVLRTVDPGPAHVRNRPLDVFMFGEGLIRAANLRKVGDKSLRTVAERLAQVMDELSHSELDSEARWFCEDDEVARVFEEREKKLLAVFGYFAVAKAQVTKRAGGPSMNLNEFLQMFVDLKEVTNARLGPRQLHAAFAHSAAADGLLPQQHAVNADAEIVFDEFCEALLRCALADAPAGADAAPGANLSAWLDKTFLPCCARVLPYRLG